MASKRDDAKIPTVLAVGGTVFVAAVVLTLAFIIGVLLFREPGAPASQETEADSSPLPEWAREDPSPPPRAAPTGPPMQPGQRWEGQLSCPSRSVDLALRLVVPARAPDEVHAEIVVTGSGVHARWLALAPDESPHFSFAPTGNTGDPSPGWLGQPTLAGEIDNGQRFRGTAGAICTEFVLDRIE